MAEDEKLEGVQFRVPAGMVKAFGKLAEELGCTKSDLYRAAFREHLKRAKVEWEA